MPLAPSVSILLLIVLVLTLLWKESVSEYQFTVDYICAINFSPRNQDFFQFLYAIFDATSTYQYNNIPCLLGGWRLFHY
jgi:hypothetical protein